MLGGRVSAMRPIERALHAVLTPKISRIGLPALTAREITSRISSMPIPYWVRSISSIAPSAPSEALKKVTELWYVNKDKIIDVLKRLSDGEFRPSGLCNLYNLVVAIELKRAGLEQVHLAMTTEMRDMVGTMAKIESRMHAFVIVGEIDKDPIIVDIAHSPYSGIRTPVLFVGKESDILEHIPEEYHPEYTLKDAKITRAIAEFESYAKEENGYSELKLLNNPRSGLYVSEDELIKMAQYFEGKTLKKESWLTWLIGKKIEKTNTFKAWLNGEELE